jgi:hypothetical protein
LNNGKNLHTLFKEEFKMQYTIVLLKRYLVAGAKLKIDLDFFRVAG